MYFQYTVLHQNSLDFSVWFISVSTLLITSHDGWFDCVSISKIPSCHFSFIKLSRVKLVILWAKLLVFLRQTFCRCICIILLVAAQNMTRWFFPGVGMVKYLEKERDKRKIINEFFPLQFVTFWLDPFVRILRWCAWKMLCGIWTCVPVLIENVMLKMTIN